MPSLDVDWALPPPLREATHPDRARARAMATFNLLAVVVVFGALVHRLVDPAVAGLSLVPVGVGLGVAVALMAALRAGVPLDLLAWALVVSVDVLLLADALHWGGLRGAGIAGLVSTPVLAAAVLAPEAALTAGVLGIGVIGLAAALGPEFNPAPPALDDLGRHADAVLTSALLLGAAGLATWRGRHLEGLQTRLAAEESRLAAAVAATHAGVFEWRQRGGIVETNARFDTLFPDPNALAGLDEPSRAELDRELAALAMGRTLSLEFDLHGPDGVRGRIHFDLLGVGGARGPGAVGVVHDVSEAWRMANLREEFVAVVGHELRTPLTSIRGALALLREVGGPLGTDREEAHAQLMRIADDNTRRLDRLIDDLLDVQQLDAGTFPIRLEPVPLERVLVEVVEQSLEYAATCGTPVRVEGVGKDLWVRADRRRLLQVLGKLVTNACKWSRRGSEVVVLITPVGAQVRLTVIDRGTGVPDAFRPHIFTRFAQAGTGAARPVGGAGLGLYIARAVTERMGGHIDFRSQPGVGSEFWVELPAVTAE